LASSAERFSPPPSDDLAGQGKVDADPGWSMRRRPTASSCNGRHSMRHDCPRRRRFAIASKAS